MVRSKRSPSSSKRGSRKNVARRNRRFKYQGTEHAYRSAADVTNLKEIAEATKQMANVAEKAMEQMTNDDALTTIQGQLNLATANERKSEKMLIAAQEAMVAHAETKVHVQRIEVADYVIQKRGYPDQDDNPHIEQLDRARRQLEEAEKKLKTETEELEKLLHRTG